MKLSPKKELAARLIAQGYTQAETYRDPRIAVTKQTMSNWNHELEFKKRILDLQTDTVTQVQEILMRSAPDAAEALVAVVRGAKEDEDAKMIALNLKASLWVLERVLGKSEKIKGKTALETEEGGESGEFAPDDDEMNNVLDSI